MAEAFLFQTAGQVLSKLATLCFHEIGRIWGVADELNRLEITLSAIKAVLLDAAEQRMKSEHVKDWLEKLQDVLYDIDDVLDDFMTEDLRWKVEIKESKRKEVRNFFSRSNPIVFRVTMSHKIKKIRKRLEDIATDRKNFQFIERHIDLQVANRPRDQTHSYVYVPDVIGRDHDKENVVELLLSSSSLDNISVIPIVGLGGLGKTTVAKLVYNDVRIVRHFEIRIWVCVSEDFDLKKLIQKIVKSVDGANISHLDLEQLKTCLHNHLMSKKFLVILDDVWNEDPKKWMELRELLKIGAEGSKIVVTTRNKTIAAFMGTIPPYKLKRLSDDACLSIFVKCAFKEGQEKVHPKLVGIGKSIVSKCGGVPLAVRTLGCYLCTKTEESEWNYIKDNDIWKIAQKDNDILPILRLSYDQMPMHLKQCFAYCSIFPKDYEIASEELINLWIAQGYIQSSDGCRHKEDIGKQYFNELFSRSFFQDVIIAFDSEVYLCKMHDLVHDLAQSVADKEFSNVNFDMKVNSKRVRHLLFCEGNSEMKEFPSFLLKQKKVRSFSLAYKVGPISKTFLDTLIKTFKYLRVLDLSGSDFEELPDSIGTLKHLRYLSLTGNNTIKALPDPICRLLNLQTLYLLQCPNLNDLPKNFGNLRSLRHLYLTSQITCLPKYGLEGLSNLQSLHITDCCFLESLSEGFKYLTALRELYIFSCPSLTCLPESMKYLTSLEKLYILDCLQLNVTQGECMEGLRSLQHLAIQGLTLRELPHGLQHSASTLKYLAIQNCPLETLPMWMENCTSLLKLGVANCPHLTSLPILVMPKLATLRVLYVKGCPELSRKCERETGEYWSSISHIPEIDIDTID